MIAPLRHSDLKRIFPLIFPRQQNVKSHQNAFVYIWQSYCFDDIILEQILSIKDNFGDKNRRKYLKTLTHSGNVNTQKVKNVPKEFLLSIVYFINFTKTFHEQWTTIAIQKYKQEKNICWKIKIRFTGNFCTTFQRMFLILRVYAIFKYCNNS